MAFIDSPKIFECKNNFIFREKEILVVSSDENLNGSNPDSVKLPSDYIINRCLEFNSGSDWFIDTVTDSAVLELQTDEPDPSGCKAIPIRQYFSCVSTEQAALAARQKAFVNWRASNRYCSLCGSRLETHETETAKKCRRCGNLVYPRIEPCIIVLVSKGDELLLARHKNRNQNMYACIAGFIEAGETIEQAVHREVMEETGIKIKNLVYKGSQGWPFPDQLMLAFTAEYESGEIRIQEDELTEAKWIKRTELPEVVSPAPGSVAHKLINNLF